MRKRMLVVAAVVGLVASTFVALPALAAPALTGTAVTKACDDPKGLAAGAKAAGAKAADAKADKVVMVCAVKPPAGATKLKAGAGQGAQAIGPAAVIDTCRAATDFPPVWYRERTEACMMAYVRANVWQTRTLRYLGYIDIDVMFHAFSSTDSASWNVNIDASVSGIGEVFFGSVSGALLTIPMSCAGACQTFNNFVPTPVWWVGATGHGRADFLSLVGAGGVETAQMSGRIGVGSTDMLGDSVSTAAEPLRCDSATPGRYDVGCIFEYAAPATFPAYLSRQYPDFARHVRDAQNSGLPGSPLTRPLHRLVDQFLIDRNGRIACPDRWPRPEFYSCDEYPFRSTWEGAGFEQLAGFRGRTFDWCGVPLGRGAGDRGWSACFIFFRQNSGAGATLGNWYRANRILDREPFYVETP
jgi:hypothetical protein